MRDALGLAVALLDGLLELVHKEPEREGLSDIAIVFQEAIGIAARGAEAANRAAERGDD